jgi:hypothetical protein
MKKESIRITNYLKLLEIGHELLVAIGEDPEREGLLETPRRWANFWRELIEYDPGALDVTFESVATDQMVCVSGMRVFSLCEHHLMPFWCDVIVPLGLKPNGLHLGASRCNRLLDLFSPRDIDGGIPISVIGMTALLTNKGSLTLTVLFRAMPTLATSSTCIARINDAQWYACKSGFVGKEETKLIERPGTMARSLSVS